MFEARALIPLAVCAFSLTPIDPSTGRVLESFESYPEMDSDLEIRVRLQLRNDEWNAEWTPNTRLTHQYSENSFIGAIQITNVIHRGKMSVVARIPNHQGRLIKYEVNCEPKKSVHPLIRDFWYMNDANAIGIAPAALFLSPPSELCDYQEGKCAFDMTDDDFERCRNEGGILRYMIMEEARGVSLHNFRRQKFHNSSGNMGIRNSLSIGAKLIDLIQRLHEDARVVHGDIHSPNVMIDYNDETGNFTLQLIDFGLAFNNKAQGWPENRIRNPGYFYHQLHTIWQMEGYHWAPRDDIAKAFQVMAQMMHSFLYLDYEARVAEAGANFLRDWKNKQNWFVTPIFDPLQKFKTFQRIKDMITNQLFDLLQMVRALRINDPIPYTNMGSRMIECLENLPARANSTTEQ